MPYKSKEMRLAAARESKARARSGQPRQPLCQPRSPELAELRVDAVAEVTRLLRDQVTAVLADEAMPTETRARVIGYLAGLLLRAHETGSLQSQLDEVRDALDAQAGEASPFPARGRR